jgi:hypothetical protein
MEYGLLRNVRFIFFRLGNSSVVSVYQSKASGKGLSALPIKSYGVRGFLLFLHRPEGCSKNG